MVRKAYHGRSKREAHGRQRPDAPIDQCRLPSSRSRLRHEQMKLRSRLVVAGLPSPDYGPRHETGRCFPPLCCSSAARLRRPPPRPRARGAREPRRRSACSPPASAPTASSPPASRSCSPVAGTPTGGRPAMPASRRSSISPPRLISVRSMLRFPLPHRHDDGFAVTNVYEGRVILPVTVDGHRPAAPVELGADARPRRLRRGLRPEHFDGDADRPGGGTGPAVAADTGGRARPVPRPAEPGVFAVRASRAERRDGQAAGLSRRRRDPMPARRRDFRRGPGRTGRRMRPVPVAGEARRLDRSNSSRRGAKTPIEGAALRLTLAAGRPGHRADRSHRLDADSRLPISFPHARQTSGLWGDQT